MISRTASGPLDRITQPRRGEHKTIKGVNFFNPVE
jgi:hypothetical protein